MAKNIYLISPKKIYRKFYADLTDVLKSNKVKFFQLRLKKTSRFVVKKHILNISKITRRYKVKFIINDDPYFAKLSYVDGCHLGQSDMELKLARKIIKNKIIGVTCHNSLKFCKSAIKNNADYIAMGSFYKSKLKPKAKVARLENLRKVKKLTSKKIVAIGGINNTNYKKILRYGANYIALSSFIWNNPSLIPGKAIKEFR